MSKDLIFESEKLEKRQKVKKILIPVAIVAAVLIIAVVIALIIGKNKGEIHTGGEGTLYPFSWTENKDGSMTLYLPKPQVEKHDWISSSSVPEVAAAVRSGKDTAESAVFSVVPETAGRTMLSFILQNTETDAKTEDFIYCLEMILNVADEGGVLKTSVYSGTGRSMPGAVSGSDEEGYLYQITVSQENQILIQIHDNSPARQEDSISEETVTVPAGAETGTKAPAETEAPLIIEGNNLWECVSAREDIVQVNGVSVWGRQVTVRLQISFTEGTSEIRTYCDRLGKELLFTVTVGPDRSVSISSDRLGSYEPVPIETFEDNGNGPAIVTAEAQH